MGPVTELYTIPDLLVRAAERDPDGDCLVFPNEHITFRSQLDRAVLVARSLIALGVGKGDHVAMVLPRPSAICLGPPARPCWRRSW